MHQLSLRPLAVLAAILATCVLALALASCSSKSRSTGDLKAQSDNLTTQAVTDVLSGSTDYDSIQGRLAQALAFNSDNVDARVMLGVVVLLATAQDELAAGNQGDQLLQRAGLVNGASGGSLWDFELELENHGQGLFKDTTPTLGELQGYFNGTLRPALDAVVAVLDTVPADWQYVIPAANGGLLLEWLAPGQSTDLRIDYGDAQIAAAAVRAVLGIADLLGAFDLDNFAPNDIDLLDDPNLDVLDVIRTQYANLGRLLDVPALDSARSRLTAGWQNYVNASAWIRGENPEQQSQGLLTLGRDTFGDPIETQAFLAAEAGVRTLGQRVVDSWFSDINVLFDVDPLTGQALAAEDQAQINFFRFFVGIDLRELYFETVVDPIAGMRLLGVGALAELTPAMANFQNVIASIGGQVPTAGDLQELIYSVRVDSPAFSSKVIDGNFAEWQSGRTQVGDAPAAYVDQPAPDLGRHYVAIDNDALYVYLDTDLTPALLGGSDRYQIEVSAPGYTARVTYQFGVGHQSWASIGPAPTFVHNAGGIEIRFPIANVSGDWLELERETEANNSVYEFDSNPEPVFVKVR